MTHVFPIWQPELKCPSSTLIRHLRIAKTAELHTAAGNNDYVPQTGKAVMLA